MLECCLELLERDLLVSLQDLGAAGLTSSAGEMAAAGGVGIDLDVDRVPLREADMEPFEIMVSESQERMLGGRRAGEGGRGRRGLREVADRLGGDRRRHRLRRDPDPPRRRGRRRDAGRGAGRRLPALRPRAGGARRDGSTATGRRLEPGASAEETLLATARLAEHRLQALGLRAVRLGGRLADRAPARVRRRRRPRDPRGRATRSRSRSTATGAGSPATPTPGRSRPSSSAPRTWPASGPSRSGSPTASTSAIPRSRPGAWQLDRSVGRPGRGLRGARRPGRRRQRLPLQRGARRARSTRRR